MVDVDGQENNQQGGYPGVEPPFWLVKTDPFAPGTIRHWANVAEASDQVPADKIENARKIASDIKEEQRRTGEYKFPD